MMSPIRVRKECALTCAILRLLDGNSVHPDFSEALPVGMEVCRALEQ